MNLQNLDFTPLWITMKTGVAATFVSFFLGIFAARFVMGRKGKARAFWDGFLTMPLVLPPTVAGYILLRTFSTRRPFGRFLANSLGIQAVHTWLGCVLAATVIAFPLMYRNARAAFEQVDENVIYAAQTLGLSERTIFWKIRIPMAKPGILSGTVWHLQGQSVSMGRLPCSPEISPAGLRRSRSRSPWCSRTEILHLPVSGVW